MSKSMFRTAIAAAAVAVCAMGQTIGPSTSTGCYVIPNASVPPGSVATVALLTAGDAVGGYRMVGIPDGMGAFEENGNLTFVTGHELGAASGIVRAHGSIGAFVSRFSVDPSNDAILSGRDHNTSASDVYVYDRTTATWNISTFAWDRFCSADLAEATAFQFGGLGTPNRIFLNGEETRPPFATRHGSAWAHVLTGPGADESWEVPHLGQCAFENVVASPFPQVKTVVVCLDDSDAQTNPALTTQPSEVYIYVGDKQATGNDITKAGLVGGTLYGVRARVGGVIVPAESNTNGLGGAGPYVGSGTFELVSLGDASTFIGAVQQTNSIANDVLRMQRVEDGAWDPRPGFENDFYFLTTASTTTNSRLWRLRFTAIGQPELGGQIDIVLNGTEGQQMMDNMTIDSHGRIFMQEDPGSASRLAKIWMYDLVNGRFIEVAAHNPVFFATGGASFLTTNEEASGIIPVFESFGDGWYLMCVQNHAVSADSELVEGGQFLTLFVEPGLGRDFALWYDSPLAAGSIRMRLAYGTPSATYFSAVSQTAGAFPLGGFFGIDINIATVIAQYLSGDPFTNVLTTQGRYDSTTYTGLPSGFTIYGVALDDVSSATPQVSAPVTYTVP